MESLKEIPFALLGAEVAVHTDVETRTIAGDVSQCNYRNQAWSWSPSFIIIFFPVSSVWPFLIAQHLPKVSKHLLQLSSHLTDCSSLGTSTACVRRRYLSHGVLYLQMFLSVCDRLFYFFVQKIPTTLRWPDEPLCSSFVNRLSKP